MSKQKTIEEYKKLQLQIKIKEGLPHLFGFKWYPWQKEFLESTNRDCILLAPNQVGKSTVQIAKAIHWATETSLWDKLWLSKPTMFWYLMPSLKLATMEVKEKWLKELLPRNGFETDPKYGFEIEYKNKIIHAIRFNSGVSLYFMSYSQDTSDLQAASVYAMFTDEELPEVIMPELQSRLRGTRGYFSMVFTATLGQNYWRQAFLPQKTRQTFKDAWKKQITLYDCQRYADGTKSQWTDKRIDEEIKRCGTQREVDRRILGKFVVEDGLKYPAFNMADHLIPAYEIPRDWSIYSAVDIGTGGQYGHPAAIVFIAVNPEYSKAVVFKSWRGDGIDTTAGDVLKKYLELRGSMKVVQQFYDWAAKDFFVIASRYGESFLNADKSHEMGENLVNTLYKNNMLFVFDNFENRKLADEYISLRAGRAKNNEADDLVDAVRYCVMGIPFDFSVLKDDLPTTSVSKKILNDRDQFIEDNFQRGQSESEQFDIITNEITEWDELINDFDE